MPQPTTRPDSPVPSLHDLSSPEWEAQAEVVDRLIDELGAAQTPCIRVYNKCDAYLGILPHGENVVCISARTGEGTAELLQAVEAVLARKNRQVVLHIPYSALGILDELHRTAAVLRTEYLDGCVEAEVIVKPEQYGRVERYLAPEEA